MNEPKKSEGGMPDFLFQRGDFSHRHRRGRPSEVKVFDYFYGVLHSPAYRETFAEFLKIDFPRNPYPPAHKSSAMSARRAGNSAAST